ncbi:MAG: InlB B-repeat-containing protein [Clostridia bacterium]|nr:InlB B-repeat-containing protein [Clostridia bacterium]
MMSKILRKTTLWVLSLLFALCISILGIHTVFSASAEDTPAVVNLTFNALGLNGGENNDNTIVSGRYLTAIRFNQGVLTGSTDKNTAVYDYSNITENAVFTGEGEYGFVPGATKWALGYKTDAVFNFIYLWTANAPVSGDTLLMKAGSYFTMSGTMADGTACNDKYVLAEDINVQFNGTAWEVYNSNEQPPVEPPVVEPTEPVLVTFTNINASWNNNTETYNNGNYYTVLHLDGVLTSGYLGQGDDWSEMLANATINGGESYFNFSSASYIVGPNVEANFIILYSATAPTNGDEFIVTAGATFKVGGDDANVYELANDICLKFKDTAWEIFDPNAEPPIEPPVEPPVEPEKPMVVEVTFNALGLNGGENNDGTIVDGKYLTAVRFNQGVLSGSTDGATAAYDFTNLVENTTNNGSFEFGFAPAATKWAAGYKNEAVFNFIYLWTSNQPTKGDTLLMKAGAYFMMSGTLEDGSVCNDKYILAEDMNLKFNGDFWVVPSPIAEFVGVNAWNNNIVTLAGSRLTILDFDVTAMGNAVSTDKNLIAMAGVSINGVKLTDIDGASITYMHGDNHMGIDIPASAIYPTQEYPITILKVAAGTVFENYELPEITLSLIGGTWVVGEFETMPEEDEYVTVSDITGEERVELGAEGLMSAMDGFEGDVSFKFVYRSDEAIMNYAPYGGLAVYLNSTNSWDGWRIFFVGNVVYVYDATMGGVGDEHVLLGQAEFGIASSFEMQIEISVKQVGGKYSIVIGGSCAKILELNDITPIGDCIGGGISLYSATRSCSVKDYKYGDVFDPVLTINSKQEIVINEGEAVPEIDATAVDGLTEITPTYVWDEGAITDGKMNVGVWNCVVTATDANGNYATATVRVTVKGEPKYTVTFDGKNEAEYAYGEKIIKPTDPTKEATVKVQYTFDGWYNGSEKWDFDHDIVISDVALVAKFIESDVYYKVEVTISGETQTIYVTYGAQVDLSVFDKEGFEKEVKQNGEVITKLIVTEDTAIEVAYAKPKKNKSSGGCAGSLTGACGLGVLLTAIGGCMLMRKKGDDNEK